MKRTRGFTIIEIIITIVVISILTTLTIVVFARVQAGARNDSARSKSTVISEAIEKYYDNNGEYPTCAQLTNSSATVVSNTLSGVSADTLTRAGAAAGTNSINCTSTDTVGFYYTSSTNSYSLKYKEDYTGNTVTFSKQRGVYAPSVLTVNSVEDKTVSLSFTGIVSATNYSVKYKPSASSSWTTAASISVPGNTAISVPSLGIRYDFQIVAATPTGDSYSNIVSRTTIPAPASLSVNGVSVVGSTTDCWVNSSAVTWTGVSNSIAVQYRIDYDQLPGGGGWSSPNVSKTINNPYTTANPVLTTSASSTSWWAQDSGSGTIRVIGIGQYGEKSSISSWTSQTYPPLEC